MKTTRTMILTLLALIFGAAGIDAQVTIGNDTPPNATLDVVATKTDGSTAEGIIAPRLTLGQLNAAKSQYGAAQTGAFVFITGIADGTPVSGYSDQITCTGYAWFNGLSWIGDCAVAKTYATILLQPKVFSFYETGMEAEVPLVFSAGGSSAMSYQWHKIVGNNVHVRISQPCTATDGTGYNTNSFTPNVTKGTTIDSKNTGFYRYYCVAKTQTNDSVVSHVAEVAVGCGAKNLNGEWLSFMCFNLGASELTIDGQKNHAMTFSPANDVDGRHYYIAGEENVYGDLYQWGRIGDGHEKRGAAQGFIAGEKTAGTNQAAYGTGPVYEDGNLIGPAQRYPERQVARTDAAHYGKFILAGAAQNNNWAYNLPESRIDVLWRTGRFAPNDPCAKIKADGLSYETYYPETDGIGGAATNWRTPSQNEWGSIYKGGTLFGSSATAIANTWTWYGANGRGAEIKPDGVTTTLFLPASGSREYVIGFLGNQGTGGYYWSSNITNTNAHSMVFSNGSVNPAGNHYRVYGFALRCVKNS